MPDCEDELISGTWNFLGCYNDVFVEGPVRP
jgi:hypothetical protein